MNDFISSVLPPKSGDADGTYRWQWAVFMKLWLLIGFAVWALDLVPGFPGLAKASDVDALASQISQSRVESLETSIFNMRIKQCATDIPPAVRQVYSEQVSKMLHTYHALTGVSYPLPDCGEVR